MLTPSPVSGTSRFFIAFRNTPDDCDLARKALSVLLNC
jgi:hypothetical protein